MGYALFLLFSLKKLFLVSFLSFQLILFLNFPLLKITTSQFSFIPFKTFFVFKVLAQWGGFFFPAFFIVWFFFDVLDYYNNLKFFQFYFLFSLSSLFISFSEALFAFFSKENWLLFIFLLALILLPLISILILFV